MKYIPFIILMFLATSVFGQLGFCEGSKGDPIFHENFGTGNTSGPALSPGKTNYTYVTGDPQDGEYTISNSIGNTLTTWHPRLPTSSTPSGRALIVNASYSPGQFYRTEITGLCQSTTYEFSAFLMNIYDRGSNGCDNGGIPNNVRFEIWDETETLLLKAGDTGDIPSTHMAQWKQFALTFRSEANQGTVILKMFNNGEGGCGNDLAIDDIVFKSCGDFTEVTQGNTGNTSLQVCTEDSPVALSLVATSDASVYTSHFYQWQQSQDGETFVDLPGETSNQLHLPSVVNSTHFRVKVAEDAANLLSNECSSASKAFYLEIIEASRAPISLGDVSLCSNQSFFTPLVVKATADEESIDWYDAPTGGNLLAENSTSFTPTAAGTYYAQAKKTGASCTPSTRTAVSLSIFPAPIAKDQRLFLCKNTTINLTAGVSDMSYSWSTGEITHTINIDTPGRYSVEIKSSEGCTATKTIEVLAVTSPEIEDVLSNGSDLEISMKEPGAFLYSLDGANFQPSGHFPSLEGGVYTIYIQDTAGCETLTREYVHLVFPSFFTPNGDGYNDFYELKGLAHFGASKLRIFDRYGRLLFADSNRNIRWDGTVDGRKLPSDDYWFEVVIEGYAPIKGHFSLIR